MITDNCRSEESEGSDPTRALAGPHSSHLPPPPSPRLPAEHSDQPAERDQWWDQSIIKIIFLLLGVLSEVKAGAAVDPSNGTDW